MQLAQLEIVAQAGEEEVVVVLKPPQLISRAEVVVVQHCS